eukprot:14159229-Alexandrium_andersonii.AAC.1
MPRPQQPYGVSPPRRYRSLRTSRSSLPRGCGAGALREGDGRPKRSRGALRGTRRRRWSHRQGVRRA